MVWSVYRPFRPKCRFDKECVQWCEQKRHMPDRIPDCYVHRCYCVKKLKKSGKFEKEETLCKEHPSIDCLDILSRLENK